MQVHVVGRDGTEDGMYKMVMKIQIGHHIRCTSNFTCDTK